ncbi:flavin reductase family protein [Pseudoalteromonas piratica]|uniref:Flavin oxidoreductase n=1 Tax=Pseudoalteromonas piratica TaxID=1348114 RepID=A0A0A7EJ95_9GAMM|nr:flavin reductase [Pseudoalteromonas piratica]AIY66598.1 flavin oxidoreductase [Pseudoalteromonas piratica]
MIKHITQNDIHTMEQRQRARLINSLSGFKSANLIGSQSDTGVTNLAIVSSVFHLGANPALIGMIIRPDTVPRDTLSNIKATGVYTINHVNSLIWQQAHQTSARYPEEQSEFEKVALTEQFETGINAPFVGESQVKFALNLREIKPLEINGTVLVIGEISHIVVPDIAIAKDGYIDIEALDTIAISGLDSYHTTDRLGRLSYAKPDVQLTKISVDGEAC